MKKVLKWIGIVLGALVGLVLLAGITLHLIGRSRFENSPNVPLKPVAVPTDAEAIARGQYLARHVSLCTECHATQLQGGEVFIEGEMGVTLVTPNLTAGQGGVGRTYTDADWEKAIRHGIGADGRTLVIMPSALYSHMSDEDLGALIAYLKSVPPVDNEVKKREIGFPGTILFGFLAYDDVAQVGRIDHDAVGRSSPAVGPTAAYGEYLTYIAGCRECHGRNLAGNFQEDAGPMGPNLTPTGLPGRLSQADFINLIQTGMRPDNTQLSEDMPWASYSGMNPTELEALWAYLSSLEPLPDNPVPGS